MSAYICNKEHFIYIIGAAMAHQFNRCGGSHFSYYHGESRHDINPGDFDQAAESANVLLRENIKSVSARYPGESSATLPGPNGGVSPIEPKDFRVFVEFDPVQVLKAVHCLQYQSCEHDGWKTSEAAAILDQIIDNVCRSLPGYEDAAWGAPEKKQVRRVA